MKPSRPAVRALALTSTVPLLISALTAQDPQGRQGLPEGVTREQMWPAPTAEDWKKPVLITFQRTWEDAVAVSKETGKPILICVNMDGEIASEHYAGIRYREPEKAALYEPYVCVIASVYRHSPRDFDEQGRRVLCPRFGSVTCGEHIAIEPLLYEKYFDGQRIAPRHIMVELGGEEVYDVFYAWDTDSVFEAIEDGIANREVTPPAIVRGDRTLVERVASRDIVDRVAVESAYRQGDAETKRQLLEAAIENIDADPLGILRLSIFGFDPELSELARDALARSDSPNAAGLIAEALRVPMESEEREALVAALERIGESYPQAKTLAVVHRGLATRSDDVDVEGWSDAMRGGSTYAAPSEWSAVASRVDEKEMEAAARPDDAEAHLDLAEASLELAVDPSTSKSLAADPRTASTYARLMFEDARRAAEEAAELGAEGWRLDAVMALCAYYTGDVEEAYALAEKAMPEIPTGTDKWSAIATIALFAQARQKAILDALRQKEEWPGEWLTDVSAAYSVLARHPLGTDEHVAAHYNFLCSLAAIRRAERVLEEGLDRFPDSWVLHDCLRNRILADKGVEGLESTYRTMLEAEDASENLHWFAGYAAMVAAELHRRRGNDEEALAAYDRAVGHYERGIEVAPETKATADHYIALAHAGRARIAYERRDYEKAVTELVRSLERKPRAAASPDGLNITPMDTARMLRARLTEQERTDLLQRLQAAIDELDPELLELPAYERGGPGGPRRGGRGRRGPGRRGR